MVQRWRNLKIFFYISSFTWYSLIWNSFVFTGAQKKFELNEFMLGSSEETKLYIIPSFNQSIIYVRLQRYFPTFLLQYFKCRLFHNSHLEILRIKCTLQND